MSFGLLKYQYHNTNTTPSPNLSVRQSWERFDIDFLRIHVTKMLQGIYISLRSAGNFFPAFARAILFSKSSSLPPPPPINKKMKWAVLYIYINILFSLTLNSKFAQGWGRGQGVVTNSQLFSTTH